MACAMCLTPFCAGAVSGREVPLTAGVFYLLAQEMVELPAGGHASIRTAEVSADLLALCSSDSFGQRNQAEIRQLAKKALDNLSSAEREMFMNNFEDSIVPFCDGVFNGDETCLSLLEDAGVTADPAWTGEPETAEESDQDRWEILKAAVLSLQDSI